jgi:hypothetical protein
LKDFVDALADLDPDVQRLIGQCLQLLERVINHMVTRGLTYRPILTMAHALAGRARVVAVVRRGAVAFAAFLAAD